MIRLGALMSQDLVDDLVSTLQHTAVTVISLGPSASGIASVQTHGLHALVVELSDAVCDGDPRDHVRVPIAGIPVCASSADMAARYAIESVLRGPEDLERFVGGLDTGDVAVDPQAGHIMAVWWSAGAPGRTTLAVATAVMLATRNSRVVLIDADTYAPAIAPVMGLSPTPRNYCRQPNRPGRWTRQRGTNRLWCAMCR